MRRHILSAHKALSNVYGDGKYSNLVINESGLDSMATRLALGVLENDVKIEYILSTLVQKKPQKPVYILLKIGVYALENLDNVPKFAIVSECVEVAKSLGKGGASGFVNAVLKKVASKEYKLPSEKDKNYLSVTYSKPKWFVDKLIKQYGKERAVDIISSVPNELEHIRVNSRLSSIDDVAKRLDFDCERSEVGGLIVKGGGATQKLFFEGLVTFQSPSSMLAVQALSPKKGNRVLDLCSAPGGKAVYISELIGDGKVTACEIHPHRLELIRKYKTRMKAQNVEEVFQDATKFNEKWVGKFDCVLVDAPCSCFGTFKKHPDVFLTKCETDIYALAATQKSILQNAGRYVKKGGIMVYSTCTLFDEENSQVVKTLLSGGEFELEHIDAVENILGGKYKDNGGEVQILPQNEYDGFYIARLKRV